MLTAAAVKLPGPLGQGKQQLAVRFCCCTSQPPRSRAFRASAQTRRDRWGSPRGHRHGSTLPVGRRPLCFMEVRVRGTNVQQDGHHRAPRAPGSCATSSQCPAVCRQRPGGIPGPAHRSSTGAAQHPAPVGHPSLLSPRPPGRGVGPCGAPTSAGVAGTSGCLLKAGQTHACVAFGASFQLVLIMCLNVQRE